MAQPSTSVLIKGLPESIDDQTITTVFSPFGKIKRQELMGNNSAVVEFEEIEKAKWLVENLNGNVPQGLEGATSGLELSYVSSGQITQGVKGAKGSAKGDDAPCDNVYISGLPVDFTDERLKEVFGAFGNIVKSRLMEPNEKYGTRIAFIQFSSLDEARWLVENVNGNIAQGLTEPITVKYKQDRYEKGGEKGGCDPWGKGWGKTDAWGKGNAWGKGDGWGKSDAWNYGKGDGWGPYADAGKGKNGKGKGKKGGIRTLVRGLFDSGAMPGGVKYENDANTLWVGGLPFDTVDLNLYQIFAPFGAIAPRGVKAMLHPDGTCKGFGFVNYMESSSSQAAIQTLKGTQMPDGSILQIEIKKEFNGEPAKGGKAAGKDGT